MQNFLLLPGLFPIEPMIAVAWSLSYEMFYYLTIPLTISILKLRDRSPIWRISFFLGVAGLIIAYCLAYGGHIRLIMFIAGILVFEAMQSQLTPTVSGQLGLVALFFGLLAVLIPLGGVSGAVLKSTIRFFSFFMLCIACFQNPLGWLSSIFSWTPLRWLGNMSYSYYLLHGLTLQASFLVFSKLLPNESFGSWIFFILLPPMFILTLIPSVALFLFIERPFSLTLAIARSKKT